jgi:hypothetical protein
MRTEQNKTKGANGSEDAVVDPEQLWLDQSIEPEELVQLDPLDITGEMVEQAEQPELADWTVRRLRPRSFSLGREAAERELRIRHGVAGRL